MKNGVLSNVYFYYTRIKEPTNKYNSSDKEFKVDVVVDAATYKRFTKELPKKSFKLIENDEFAEKYRAEPPFPEQAIQYVTKFNRDEVKKDGTPIAEEHKPKVYLEDQSGEVYDITTRYDVGNGSMGDLFYFVIEHSEYGNHPKLSNIKVKKLVKYEAGGGTNLAAKAKVLTDDVDLSAVIDDSNVEGSEPTKPTPSASPAAKSKPAPTSVVDDDIPF